MKQLRKIFLLLISLVLLSCQQQAALKYNNYIVGLENALLPDMRSTLKQVETYSESGKWDSVAFISRRMQAAVKQSMDEIRTKDLPEVTGAGEFRLAAIRYFRYIADVYGAYISVAGQPNEAARTEELKEFHQLINQRAKVVKTFQDAQLSFTKANNVALNEK